MDKLKQEVVDTIYRRVSEIYKIGLLGEEDALPCNVSRYVGDKLNFSLTVHTSQGDRYFNIKISEPI